MKKILGGIMILAFVMLSLVGCTEQQRVKELGLSTTIELPPGAKLVTATWKQDNFWYLVRPRNPDEKPEKYIFIESSSFGLIEGRVFIVEK